MRLYPRQNKNGTVTWWASWTENKATQKRSTRQHTRELARLVVDRWSRERADPEREKARQARFGEESTDFLKSCRARCAAGKLAPDTVSMYEQKLANLCDVIGRDTSMADVDAERVLAYFDQRAAEGAADTTQYKEWVALRGVLTLSRHKGRFAREVASVKPPHLRADYKPRKTWLTWEQADLLLAEVGTWTANRQPAKREIGPLDRRRTVAFVLATGARRKEWTRAGHIGDGADIDWERGVVRIHGTKTEGAASVIPIPSPMRRWLGIAGTPPFPPWGNARRDILAACERVEARLMEAWQESGAEGKAPAFPRVTWNDLRRTFVSLLLQAGVPPHVLRHLSRHKTTRMIDLVYGQQTTESVGRLVEESLVRRDPPASQQRSTKANRRVRRDPE